MNQVIHAILSAYVPVVKALASMLGPEYEVVLHDVRNPSSSIIAIENSHVTGREVGGPLTDLGLKILGNSHRVKEDYIADYLTHAPNGKRLRSTTVIIRGENRKILGFLCINYDMTRTERMKDELRRLDGLTNHSGLVDLLESLTTVSKLESLFEQSAERFPTRFDQLLQQTLDSTKEELKLPENVRSRPDRIRLIKALNEKGFFQVKGAVEMIATCFGLSIFTIYSYLREAKEGSEEA